MIQIHDNDACCGCGVCAGVCPQGCIAMEEDAEGFLLPRINSEECVRCNLCEKVCPMINVSEDIPDPAFNQKGYVVQHKNAQILEESTAGGAFTAIANNVVEKNGIVFGAVLSQDLYATPSAVYHKGVETKADLRFFRNSKYVQSYVSRSVIQEIKSTLEQGRYVCFSGTPCQVEGVKRFLDVLHIDQEKAVLVDVVCHAIPSPKAFRQYVSYMEKSGVPMIKSMRFRDKHYGYKYSTMNIVSNNNHCNYHRGIESDPWLRAYFSNICDRKTCYNCSFKKIHRVSDFTIWDCFQVDRLSREMDNDKGATRVLIHTRKGQSLFEQIKDDVLYEAIDPQVLIQGGKSITVSAKLNPQRTQFMRDMNSMSGSELYKKYFPLSFKYKMKHRTRLLVLKTGLYAKLKKCYLRTKSVGRKG